MKKATDEELRKTQKGRETIARNYAHPVSANVTALIKLHETADHLTMAEELATKTKKVLEGDLSFAEMMLISQA